MNLEKLTIRELIDIYNEHSGKKPIRAFSNKKAAVERVRAVLPAARSELDVSMFRKPIRVNDLAKLLGTTPNGARGHIDRARRAGHDIVNVERGVFALRQ